MHLNQASDSFRYKSDGNSIEFFATCDIKMGDECFAVYSSYPNAKLAFSYGFVVQNNPHRGKNVNLKKASGNKFFALFHFIVHQRSTYGRELLQR